MSAAVALYPSRPEAEHFPMMSDERFGELIEHIRTNGLLDPIVLHEGAILDGRNRYWACVQSGVEPRFVEWDGTGGTPLEFVWGKNAQRRDLTEDQRKAIGAEVLELSRKHISQKRAEAGRRGGQAHHRDVPDGDAASELKQLAISPIASEQTAVESPESHSRSAAAKEAGVSEYGIRQAETVMKADPDLHEQVKAGKVSLKQARAKIQADTSPIENLPNRDPAEAAEAERCKLIAAYSKQTKELRKLLLFEPDALAAAFDREHADAYHILAADTRSWLDRVEQAAGSGQRFRIIGGSR